MDDFIKMLQKVKPGVDFTTETKLVDDGILDSLDIISIMAEIADVYGVVIPSEEIVPENFNSAAALKELVDDLM
jgi:acyl carrier protein